MTTVTVDPPAMRTVSHDADVAISTLRRDLHAVESQLDAVADGGEVRRTRALLADLDHMLSALAQLSSWPARIAAAMAHLDRRVWSTADRRAARRLRAPSNVPPARGRPTRPSTAAIPDELLAAAGPAAVAMAWSALSANRRADLQARGTRRLANLDGIPVPVRDAIHRRLLDAEIAALEATMAPAGFLQVPGNDLVGPAARGDHRRRLDRLLAIMAADRILVVDLTGDGRAVLAVGDPATAAHVATVVPGIGTTLEDVDRLAREARALQERAAGLQPDPVATIAWLGYDTPPGAAEITVGLLRGDPTAALLGGSRSVADSAVPHLTDHLAAIRQANPSAHHTLVGHSYGSVVAVRTMRGSDDPAVDQVVVLGSPGAGRDIRSAADLDWPDGVGLWSATAATDPVPHLPVLGPGPDRLGAVPLPLGPGNGGHVAYLAAGTWGLDAVAQVVVGRHGCPPAVVSRNRRQTSSSRHRVEAGTYARPATRGPAAPGPPGEQPVRSHQGA